jgi:hypothetical protein
MMPGLCSEKSALSREGRGLAPQAFRRGEHMGRVGFDPRSFFPRDGRSPLSHPTCDVPFPLRRSGEYWNSARPLYQGFRGSVWDPETSRERVGDWSGQETGWALLLLYVATGTRQNGELGCSTRCRHMLGPERPETVSPGRGVVLTDLQSL